MGKSRAKAEASSLILAEFAAAHPRCMLCGTQARQTWPPKICLHHIARGADRELAREERSCLIATCTKCHEARLDGMPVAVQLALKRLFDADGYDRQRVNSIRSAHNLRGPQLDAIAEEEVDAECARLKRQIAATGTGWPFPRWSWN